MPCEIFICRADGVRMMKSIMTSAGQVPPAMLRFKAPGSAHRQWLSFDGFGDAISTAGLERRRRSYYDGGAAQARTCRGNAGEGDGRQLFFLAIENSGRRPACHYRPTHCFRIFLMSPVAISPPRFMAGHRLDGAIDFGTTKRARRDFISARH